MASWAEDLPSCSKASTSLSNKGINAWNTNKFPVVVLAKLDLSTVSVKLSAEDLKALEKQKTSTLGLPRRSVDKPAQKNAWCDEDTVMSDISACLSDSEETETTNTKGNKDRNAHREKLEKTSFQDKTKYDSHSRSRIQDPSKNDSKKSFKKGIKETINKESKSVTLVVKKEMDVETELDEGKHRTDKRDKIKTGKTEKDVKNESDHQAKSVQKALLNQQSSLVKEIKQDDRDAGGSQPTSSRNGKLRALKRPVRAEEVDSPNVKKSKTEDIMEMISVNQETQMKNKNKMRSSNTRYKLSLDPVHMCDLGDESFRKFINLAADCVVSFNRKNNTPGSVDGKVELYFGDFQIIQSAMQRLGQLTVIASKAMIQGCIKCFDLQPRAKKDSKGRWTTNVSAKLYFKFNAGKGEKLQQLVSLKSKSKEDTKRKFIHLHRIPSSINEEMLYLLFPFSVGVKISHDESSEKAIKGPVEIEFESQEWMEAVLVCFHDFKVCSSGSYDRIFDLRIKGIASPQSQTSFPMLSTSNKQQKPFTGGQGQKRGNMNESKSFKGQYQKPFLERKIEGNNVATREGGIQSKFNQRKQQSSPPANFGQMGNRNVAMNRSFGSNGQPRGPAMMDRNRIEPQTQILLEPDIRRNSLRQLALNRGFDPNSPDVIKILEVTAQLETLQNTSVPQRSEAHGIMGLPVQQVNPEHLRDQGLQMRGFEVAEQLAGFRPHHDPAWQGLEKERAFKEDRFQQEEAADRERRLEEFERTVKQPQRRGPGVKHVNPKFPSQTSKARKSPKQIQTYRDAPATEGLLGPIPNRNEEQFEKRTRDDGNQFHQMSVDPDRNDRPLDFNRPILSAEQAFKQDIERTRAILSAHRDGSTGRSINYHEEAKYPFLEETRDLHALPVQFGKNAAKKNLKEFERRRIAEVNQNTRDESIFPRSNDRFTGAHRINPNDNFQTGRDSTLMERQEGSAEVFQSNFRDPYRIMDRRAGSLDRESFIHREERDALQRWEATDIKEQRAGLLGAMPRSGKLYSDSPVESSTQRIGQFERNEAARLQLSKSFEEFDLQARQNSLNLENEIILRRRQDLIRSQGDLAQKDWTRERELLYRREPMMEQFHQNSELNEAGWARSSHALVKENEIYQEKILEEARWHEEPQPFKQPARVQQQVDVKERSVYQGAHFTGASTGPKASRFPQADGDYQRSPAVFKRHHTDSTGVAAFERHHGDHKTPSFNHPIKRGGSVSQMKGSRGGNVPQQQRGNVNHSMAGRGAPSARRNVNTGVLGSGRGLLQLPQEFQQGGANCERHPEVGGLGVGFSLPHQNQNRALPAMPQPPLPPAFLGPRGGHGVNFF